MLNILLFLYQKKYLKMKNIYLLCFLYVCLIPFYLNAQVGIGTTNPHPSSVLDVHSTNSGMLIPRLNSFQRLSISNPSEGLMVYDINTHSIHIYNGTIWTNTGFGKFYDGITNNSAVYNIGNVGIGTDNPSEKLDVNGNVKIDGKIFLSEFWGDIQYITAQNGPIKIHSDLYAVEITADAGLDVHEGIKSRARLVVDTDAQIQDKLAIHQTIGPNNERLEVTGNIRINRGHLIMDDVFTGRTYRIQIQNGQLILTEL